MRAERAARLAALALAAVALAGCGEKDEPDVSRPTAVTGTIDLARPAPGNAAADATATTRRSALAFTGRVQPPASRVTLAPAGGAEAAVQVGADGRFRARARKLRRGKNRFALAATAPGLRAWEVAISITRR
jgi:hypothetical protein